MELVLEVVSYKDLPAVGGSSARFYEQGGTIGRSSDNQLALPDEEKFISRHHANIRFDGGKFVIQDVSTGGTWLCKEQRWVSQASAPLADGDHIKIGEYELSVRIEEGGPEEFGGLFGDQPDPLFSPFGSSSAPSSMDLFNDNPSPLPLGPLPTPMVVDSPVFPSLIGQPDASPFQESFTPPGIQQTPGPQSLEVDFSIDNFFQDGFAPSLSAQPSAPAPSKDDFFDLDQLLGDGLGLVEQPASSPILPVEKPSQPVLQEPLDIFAQSQPAATAADLRTAAMPRPGLSATGPFETQSPSSVEARPFAPSLDQASRAARPEPAQGKEPQTSPATPEPAISIPKPGRPSVPVEPVHANPAPPRQPPAPAPVQPAATAQPVVAEASELFQCFLEGAGLADLSNMTVEEQKKAMRSVGVAYREMVDGMMQVLLARKMEKSMIALRRTDVTMVQPRENNPLKVFPTVEETMKEMVCQKNPAYIEPSEAVKEGFADIMRHQMAMRAGMQAALDGFLKRLEPKSFEEHFKDGIVFQKKAKCWDAYCLAYPKLVNETLDDLFGDAFAAAYREQLRILRDS